jgi:hypothetical protein
VVRDAMREAAHETADFMQAAVAEDIESAGNFGERWVEAFHADVHETQRTVWIETDYVPEGPPVTYWKVFEYGADIEAKNPSGLMWLPWGLDKSRTGGVWPRDWPGELYRRGNVLFDEGTDQPVFFGTPSVHEEKKFHITEIVQEEAKKTREVFKRLLDEMLADASNG